MNEWMWMEDEIPDHLQLMDGSSTDLKWEKRQQIWKGESDGLILFYSSPGTEEIMKDWHWPNEWNFMDGGSVALDGAVWRMLWFGWGLGKRNEWNEMGWEFTQSSQLHRIPSPSFFLLIILNTWMNFALVWGVEEGSGLKKGCVVLCCVVIKAIIQARMFYCDEDSWVVMMWLIFV